MTLAQLAGRADQTVSMLPSPPALVHYLTENPWPVAIGLVIGGLILAIILNRRGQLKQAGLALLLGLLLAGAVVLTASLVTTEREILRARTRELVDITARADTLALGPILTERAEVRAWGPIPVPRGRDAVLATVRQTLGAQFVLKEHSTGSIQAVIDGPNVARTQVHVRGRMDMSVFEGPVGGWFRVHWVRDGDGPWRVSSVVVLQIDNVGTNPSGE